MSIRLGPAVGTASGEQFESPFHLSPATPLNRVLLRLWPFREMVVRAVHSGCVDSDLVEPGARVAAFVTIVSLDDRHQRLLVDKARAVERECEILRESAPDDLARAIRTERYEGARLERIAAEAEWDEMKYRAPFTGQIARLYVSNGQYVRAGEPLLTIVDDSRFLFAFPFAKDLVQTGTRVSVSIAGERFIARVLTTKPLAETLPSLEKFLPGGGLAYAVVSNPQRRIQLGDRVALPASPPPTDAATEQTLAQANGRSEKVPDVQRPTTSGERDAAVATSSEGTSKTVEPDSVPLANSSPTAGSESSPNLAGTGGNSPAANEDASKIQATPLALDAEIQQLFAAAGMTPENMQAALDDLEIQLPPEAVSQLGAVPEELLRTLNIDGFPLDEVLAAQGTLGITTEQLGEIEALLTSYREELEREGLLDFASLGELGDEALLKDLSEIEGMSEYLAFAAACRSISEHFQTDLQSILDERQLAQVQLLVSEVSDSESGAINPLARMSLSEEQRQELAETLKSNLSEASRVLKDLALKSVKGDTGKKLLRKIRDQHRERVYAALPPDVRDELAKSTRPTRRATPDLKQEAPASAIEEKILPRKPPSRPATPPPLPPEPIGLPIWIAGGMTVVAVAGGGVWFLRRRGSQVSVVKPPTEKAKPSLGLSVGPEQQHKTIASAITLAGERLRQTYADQLKSTEVTIEVAEGTYVEELVVDETFAGKLTIRAAADALVVIRPPGKLPALTVLSPGKIRLERLFFDAAAQATCLSLALVGRSVELIGIRCSGFQRSGLEVLGAITNEPAKLQLVDCVFQANRRLTTAVSVGATGGEAMSRLEINVSHCDFPGPMQQGIDLRVATAELSVKGSVFNDTRLPIRIIGPATVWNKIEVVNNTFQASEAGISFVEVGHCDRRRRICVYQNLFISPTGPECIVDSAVGAANFGPMSDAMCNNWSTRPADFRVPGEYFIFQDGMRGVGDIEFESGLAGEPGYFVPVEGSSPTRSWRYRDSEAWIGARGPR
ncbi:HlyD family efflux transporter periplasmic adaptor subunit [Planctopirus ephydatiae]|uniref:HlyD family efflux transporter periplasmic adaptor subunit n=1 Tax=Planctopirus ephydatiae TaxID=2528019 RepID=UPI001643D3DB|nr:HlyD family efflux transporter periplasmic adaptor subunit [Planctopirus ephydatiae]